jgi:hypothetical protein
MIAAPCKGYPFDCDLVPFAAPMMPAKNHRRAGAQC